MIPDTYPPDQLLYTQAQAARALGVSRRTVERWLASGTLDAIRIEGGVRRIPAASLRRLVETAVRS